MLPRWVKSEKRDVSRFIFEKGLLAAACKLNRGGTCPEDGRTARGLYQVGWEDSGMEREGMIRSKVVFKEGDGG